MQLILAFLALCAVASAFNMGVTRVASKGSLVMGDAFDTLQYKKIFNRFTFKTLAAAAAAAGLEETLKAAGPITIFAPTDAAFADLPAGALDGLLADPAKLKAILAYHVVPGKVTRDEWLAMGKIPTVGGGSITAMQEGGKDWVDDSMLHTADFEVDNGIIHIIDAVMFPKA
ncbi:FAS1 domain-containing protein [Ochromonadaceae sp. CCMP2298]|nr:FAS1 domain-containing protein [Ochromonadaceae sp. CCMP2298]